ncbi:Mu transposase, C-terminal [Bacillus sp. OV166]|uniref:TnsA endonuclease N-terminal domain-containing protein n=1 Tax=Bacillus sp. OV166 TaxID=1882763 RepID=UPI000A2AD969|nr:TnsA endonuclease N-terminal domain-containing protein [Bacillus sp. OV166]SMQ77558.1 Mu transposase, C-terminal [Bacillus sp. OV166]
MEKEELSQLYKTLNLSEVTIKYVEKIRESQPVRRVGGGARNVPGRYTSTKMGLTIQFESRTVELPAILLMEFDTDVYEYYDQPIKFKIKYFSTKKGGDIAHQYTPDFLVIRKDGVYLEEWKTEEELQKLSKESPYRYIKDEHGWRCPPAEEALEKYDIKFKVNSSSLLNYTYIRNVRFLEDYLKNDEPVSPDLKKQIVNYVTDNFGVKLINLIDEFDGKSDEIYKCIATKQIFIDLESELISEYSKTSVYANEIFAKAIPKKKSDSINLVVNLEVGEEIIWDSVLWRIINIGSSNISLYSEKRKAIDIDKEIFESYISSGQITALQKLANENEIEKEVYEILCSASEQELEEANLKYKYVQKYLNKEQIGDKSERTVRYWVKNYKEAEERYGNGFVGLITQQSLRGNYNRKLNDDTIALIDKFIDERYETIKQSSVLAVYNLFFLACDELGIEPCSFRTFYTQIQNRPTANTERKRKGERAAYQKERIYYLKFTTPRHGDRPFEIGHIDHTQLDIELICPITNKVLGRPYLTFLIDAYSRRILALYLTYNPPSYRSNMMVIRECVRRHNRVPDGLVVDGGKEFQSTSFETLLASLKVTKFQRPSAKARYGSVIERLFKTTNERFIYNLSGNTQITKNVRQVTKSVNPKNHAIWSLADLFEKLCEYCYEVYDKVYHETLLTSPRQLFENDSKLSGNRKNRIIPYNESLIILTLPFVSDKPTRKVVPTKGVKFKSSFYWNDVFHDPKVEGSEVKVKYDPFDLSYVYVFANKSWRKCLSEQYLAYSGLTEKELKIITEENLNKKRHFNGNIQKINAKIIAQFIKSSELSEERKLQQIKDRENRKVETSINSLQKTASVEEAIENEIIETQIKETQIIDEPSSVSSATIDNTKEKKEKKPLSFGELW